jgi:hypothetical protein
LGHCDADGLPAYLAVLPTDVVDAEYPLMK